MGVDQNGNPIPLDLVTVPIPHSLSHDAVMAADWYDAGGVLLVSAGAIDCASENDPVDSGIDLAAVRVYKVDDCLKRWSSEDGYYHA